MKPRPNSSIKLTAGPFVFCAEHYLHVGVSAAVRSRQHAVSRGSRPAERLPPRGGSRQLIEWSLDASA
jgi:hypothetical protein